MDRTISYVNHLGETVDMTTTGPWDYTDADLHDFKLSYDTLNDRITGWKRGVREFSLTVALRCRRADGLEMRNRLYEVAARDREAGEPGTLRVGESQLRCYVASSEKSLWHYDDGRMVAKLGIVSDDPVWRRAHVLSVGKYKDSGGVGLDLGSVNGTRYAGPDLGSVYKDVGNVTSRYDGPDLGGVVRNVMQVPGAFAFPGIAVITFYGPCESPSLKIGGNTYGVKDTAAARERIVIDGMRKTVIKYGEYGNETNDFSKRVRGAQGSGSYVFERVPAGELVAETDGGFAYDLEVWEERDEPAWT